MVAAFQPIFDLRDGCVVGYEALARPRDGSSPEELFARARAEGRLSEVDRECRAAALRDAAAAGLGAPFALFLNADAGALELDLPDLPHGSATLIMEITESALTERPEAVLRTLTRLRTRGWGVSLDDVGGDSRSLATMPLLYPDVIKLDLQAAGRARPARRRARRDRGRRRGRAPARDRAGRGHRLRDAAGDRARRRRDARAGLHARRARPAAVAAAQARAPVAAGGIRRRSVRPAALPAGDELEAPDTRAVGPGRARGRDALRAGVGAGRDGDAAGRARHPARAARATTRCATRSASSASSSPARSRTRGPRSRSGRASACASSPGGRTTSGCSRPPTTASWSSSARCCSWRACRRRRHLADHLRHLRALPGERARRPAPRRPGGRSGSRPRSARRWRTGARGRPRRGWRRSRSARR